MRSTRLFAGGERRDILNRLGGRAESIHILDGFVDHRICDLDPRPRADVVTFETVAEHQEVAIHCASVEDPYAADRFSVNEDCRVIFGRGDSENALVLAKHLHTEPAAIETRRGVILCTRASLFRRRERRRVGSDDQSVTADKAGRNRLGRATDSDAKYWPAHIRPDMGG